MGVNIFKQFSKVTSLEFDNSNNKRYIYNNLNIKKQQKL